MKTHAGYLVVALVVACGPGSTPPPQTSTEEPVEPVKQATETGCRGLSDCPFGFHCARLGGSCAEAECHPAEGDLAERLCGVGKSCEWEDASGAYHGVGYCAAHESPTHVETSIERVVP